MLRPRAVTRHEISSHRGYPTHLDVADTVAVSLEAEVEAAKTITRERVRTALKHNGPRTKPFHDTPDDRPEDSTYASSSMPSRRGKLMEVFSPPEWPMSCGKARVEASNKRCLTSLVRTR